MFCSSKGDIRVIEVRVIKSTAYFMINFKFIKNIYNEDSIISVIEEISVDIILKYKHKNHNLKRSQNNVILEEIYFFVFFYFL